MSDRARRLKVSVDLEWNDVTYPFPGLRMRQHYRPFYLTHVLAAGTITLTLLSGGGCAMATIPSEQLRAANYGPYPTNYQELLKEYLSKQLKDPFSAVYEFDPPVKGYTRKAPVRGGGVDQFGYVVTMRVNAKNSFGGFVGFKTYRFLVRDEMVRAEINPNSTFPEPWYQCAGRTDVVGACIQ